MSFRALLRHTVSIRRNTTQVSKTGVSSFKYETVAINVPCAISAATARMRQDEFGQVNVVKHTATFGPDVVGDPIGLRNNDLVVVDGEAETFRVVRVHEVRGGGGFGLHHVEANIESWVPSGDPS